MKVDLFLNLVPNAHGHFAQVHFKFVYTRQMKKNRFFFLPKPPKFWRIIIATASYLFIKHNYINMLLKFCLSLNFRVALYTF